jgi:hypothetical protein
MLAACGQWEDAATYPYTPHEMAGNAMYFTPALVATSIEFLETIKTRCSS